MRTFILQAPRSFVDVDIPEGYILQVVSSRSGMYPDASEVKAALHRAGFTGRADSYAAPGNWKVKELK